MTKSNCPICHTQLSQGIRDWHWVCKACGYEMATLEPAINQTDAHAHIDEQFRAQGLKTLRSKNFSKLLDVIINSSKQTGCLLDVGCAHGWFLEAAQNTGFQCLGIEPDRQVYTATLNRGLPIRQGFFPEILLPDEQFDVIVFNDVFEHIPDLQAVISGCKAHLKPDGMLVLNLPSSTGVIYKISRLLARFGTHSFFERLWQKELPSPHVHYFNPHNLNRFLQNNGFELIDSGRLLTLDIKGLYTRISYTGNYNLVTKASILGALTLSLPFIALMPADIIYSTYRVR